MVGMTIHEKPCFAIYEKTTENHPLDVAKNQVETCFSSYAVAQNPVEEEQMNITHKLKSLFTLNTNKVTKDEWIGRLTNLDLLKSPAKTVEYS